MLQIGLKKFWWLQKSKKKNAPWTYVISDLNGEEIVGTFFLKKITKKTQEEFRIEKVIKRNVDKLYDK